MPTPPADNFQKKLGYNPPRKNTPQSREPHPDGREIVYASLEALFERMEDTNFYGSCSISWNVQGGFVVGEVRVIEERYERHQPKKKRIDRKK